MIGPVSSSGRFPPVHTQSPSTSLTTGTAIDSYISFESRTSPTATYSGRLPQGVYYTPITNTSGDIYGVRLRGTPLDFVSSQTFTVNATNDIGSTSTSYSPTISFGNVSISGHNGSYTAYLSSPPRTVWEVSSSRTISITGSGRIYFLLVAGGGGGGRDGNGAGGGGAGEYIYGEIAVSTGSYPVVIGAGGAGATGTSANGSNGGNSSFAGYTARGGGYGARFGTTGGLVSSGTNAGGAGGFGSRRTGAGADGGAGGFFNGGGGGSTGKFTDFGSQPYSSPPTLSYSTIYDGSNGNASPSETGGNGGNPVQFGLIWNGTSSSYVSGGGGGGGGNNGSVSYSGSSSFLGGRGAGNAYNSGIGGNGYYYGQGGGGGYSRGGNGGVGVLLIWLS